MLITTFCFVFLLSVGVDEVVSKTLGRRKFDENVQHFDKASEAGDSEEIVGGDVVDIKQYPYQVSVLYKKRPYCGGSILSEDFVLTASHCLHESSTHSLHVGSSFVKDGGELYDVAEIRVHPNYNRTTYDYDIGILRSSSKIKINGVTTLAVRLADSTSSLKEGDNIIVTGWGLTKEGGKGSNELRAVTVPVTSHEYCSKAYSESFRSHPITERMVCAGFEAGEKDACGGDSGGPAVEEKSLVQYGIVSWGRGCARKGFPGVYAYIPPLREWIKQNTGI